MVVLPDLHHAQVGFVEPPLEFGVDGQRRPVVFSGASEKLVVGVAGAGVGLNTFGL